MRIVFMGTPDFAVGALEALVKAGHDIACAVTQPDKPKGRGKEMQRPPVKECALRHGIEVFQPVRIKAPEPVAQLRQYGADIFVVAAFGQILSREILDMPRFGCVNIHASLLPKYRGAAPIQWAILDGEKETGVTIMQMNEGLDTGDMLSRRAVPIEAADTAGTLQEKLSAAGAELIVDTLALIEQGKACPEPQDDSGSCYAKMLRKAMGRIDWERPAAELERLVRGLNPWPSAYTSFRGKTLKIWEASVLEEYAPGGGKAAQDGPLLPGTAAGVEKDGIVVRAGEGYLLLRSVQLEGKKRMPVKDFLLGYPAGPGERFGG